MRLTILQLEKINGIENIKREVFLMYLRKMHFTNFVINKTQNIT